MVPRILGGVSPDLRFRGPLKRNSASVAVKSTFPGPREGSSILNVDLVVVTAGVCELCESVQAESRGFNPGP